MRHFTLMVLVFILFAAAGVYAQQETCPAEMEVVLNTIQDECAALERNEACYGNRRIETETIDDSERFSQIGDTIAINHLRSLRTYPLSLETDEWGIAVLSLQANLPDTLPGQRVTMIVFGDAEIRPDDAAPDDYRMPMQAFYLRTGIGAPACKNVPQGGVLVQNPREAAVNLLINGFELKIASTAFLTAQDPNQLTVSTLEGNVQVTSGGITGNVPVGFTLTVSAGIPPETPAADPEAALLLSELLPEAVPQAGEPSSAAGQLIGLWICANRGGVDVAAGENILMRGGWAEYTLEDLIASAATNTPTLEFDGELLPYSYRAGPGPWQIEGDEAFVINWFWEVSSITAGTHQAVWYIGGEVFVCEIRAQ